MFRQLLGTTWVLYVTVNRVYLFFFFFSIANLQLYFLDTKIIFSILIPCLFWNRKKWYPKMKNKLVIKFENKFQHDMYEC